MTIQSTLWRQRSGPIGGTVTFGSPNSLTTTVSADTPGTYQLGFSATDGELSSEDFVEMVVTVPVTTPPPTTAPPTTSPPTTPPPTTTPMPNQAPVVDAGLDLTVEVGEVINITGTATDDALPTTPPPVTTQPPSTGFYDWGTPPPVSLVTVPTWPTPPTAQVPVTVSNGLELSGAIQLGNRFITLDADIPGGIYVNGTNNVIDLNGHTVGSIYGETTGTRTRIQNGRCSGGYQIWGSDVLVDNIHVLDGAHEINLGAVNRYAAINSTFESNSNYGHFCFDGGSNWIFANCQFVGGEAGMRLMGPIRVVVVDCRLQGTRNSGIRIHAGNLPYTGGAHHIWVARNQIEKIGGPLAGVWLNAESGSPIATDPGLMSNMRIEDNNLYGYGMSVNEELTNPNKYVDIELFRNTAYATGLGNPTGNGGDASNGYLYPTTGPDANIVQATIAPPPWSGGSTQ